MASVATSSQRTELANLLLIRYVGADAPLEFLRFDKDGRSAASRRVYELPVDAVLGASSIDVLVPSELVHSTALEIAAKSRSQAEKAAPFALEDQLASNVDDMHVALVEQGGPTRWPVLAMARSALGEILEDLKLRGITPNRMVPDAECLPEADAPCLFNLGSRSLVRLSRERTFACESGQLPNLLEAAGARLSEFNRIDWEPGKFALDILSRHYARGRRSNLLTGSYRSSGKQERTQQRWWRWLGIAAAAWLVLAMVHMGLEVIRGQSRLAALSDGMVNAYRSAVPGAQNVPNPVAQMQSALRVAEGSSSTEGGIGLLALVAPYLAQRPQISLKSVAYQNGALELLVIAPDIGELDGLRENLATNSAGRKVELVSANNLDTGIEGRLRIGGGP